MDSLYEAVQESCKDQVYTIPNRSCSPHVLLDDHNKWRSAGRCISMDISQINTDYMKKTSRSSLQKSFSETEALDSVCTNSIWHATKEQEDLVLLRNNQNEDLVRALSRAEYQTMSNRPTQTILRKTLKDLPFQTETNGEMLHLKGTKVNKVERKGNHRGTPTQETTVKCHIKGAAMVPLLLDTGAQTQENCAPAVRSRVIETAPFSGQRPSNPAETALTWLPAHPSYQTPNVEHRIHSCKCTTASSQGHQINVQTIKRDPSPKGVMQPTNMGFGASNRSTSFGRFDTFRHHSPSKLEEDGTTAVDGVSSVENCDKPGSLGKKMKAISMTMRKKMGKKHVKTCHEDMADDTEGEAENGSSMEKNSDQSSNSLESLCSGQSSSSGVASSSDVSSNRDSLKLEEEVTYTGQFCGRAKVHTDFVPSPYDTDSLKLKVGDIIDIISKSPMGIWTGLLNNKVGNFKFIYVDVLPDKEKEEENEDEEGPKIRPMKVCKKPRPNTLLELLERLHLEEYASSLLLNGYQTVDDLKHLKERHLIELNVTDPDHRQQLLAASECLYVTSRDEQEEMKGGEKDEDNDCLRDSGCFIPVECSDS